MMLKGEKMNVQVKNNLKPQAANVAPTTVTVRPRFNSPKCDPVSQAERDMTALNPNIDNNGGALYNNEAFCIVHRYETEQEEQIRENEEKGIGSCTNAEAYIIQECSFFELYDEDEWFLDEDEVFEYDEDTYSFYGTTSDQYITSVLSGEIIDEENMCKMGTPEIGSSVAADQLQNDDTDTSQEAGLDTKTDADADNTYVAQVDPDELDPALADADPNTLSNTFASAATHTRAAPTKVAPRPTEPANASAYQMSA